MSKVHLRVREQNQGVSYFLDYYLNGKRVRDPLKIPFNLPKSHRRNIAENARTKREYELLTKKGFKSKKITLSELITEFLDQYKKKDYRKVKNGFDRLLDVVEGHKLIEDVKPIDCKKFRDNMLDTYSTDTIQSYFKSVKKVFTYAVDTEYLVANPFLKIKNVPSAKEFNKDIPSKEDLAMIAKKKTYYEVKRAYLFCCQTGLGNTDCRILTYGMIKDNQVTGMRGKNRSQKIPLNNEALKWMGEGEPHQKVFDLPSDSYITKAMKELTKGTGKHLTFYSARHYFGSSLVAAGVHLSVVKDLMGHSSYKYLDRYVKLNDTQRRDAVDLI